MFNFQSVIFVSFVLYSMAALLIGFRNTYTRRNPYGHSQFFYPIGAFVWVDCVMFGLFFSLVSIISLFSKNWYLFLLIYALFWTVRSIGEQIYWFLEQFASNHRNPEKTLWISKFFPRQSSWIFLQVFWQCISVVSIICTVWAFSKWLK